jgi:hypothetical protein
MSDASITRVPGFRRDRWRILFMARIRLMLLSVLAVLAFGALASVSASASDKTCPQEKGKELNWCVEGVVVSEDSTIKEAPVEGTSGVSVLEGTVLGVKTKVECAEDEFKGILEDSGADSGEIKFKNCKVIEPENCKVKEPIEFSFISQLVLEEPGARASVEFWGPTGGEGKEEEEFVSLTFTEKPACAIAGTAAVKGSQTCELDKTNAEAWKENTTHKVICKTSGSELKLGTAKAKFSSTATIKLVSGGKFSAAETES